MAILRLFLLLLIFHLSAKADDALIQTECHNANAPQTCIQCLKSDDRSSNADKFTIATLITECLNTHANGLATNFSTLASENPTRKVYGVCAELFLRAKKEVESAAKGIKGGDFDGADRFVYNAREHNFECYSIKGEFDPQVGPIGLVDEMKVFEDLSEAAMRMIERF